MIVELIRLEESDAGTFGVLRLDKEVFCCTLEPRDLLNARNVSSIPAQQYTCERYSSARHPNTFEVMNVPGRSFILFHAGNTVGDTAGCIVLGQYFGKLRGERAILNSGKTFQDFMARLAGENSFHLTISEVF